jgi:hypothetical protein
VPIYVPFFQSFHILRANYIYSNWPSAPVQSIRRCTPEHTTTYVQFIRTQRNTAQHLCSQSGARKSNKGAAFAHVPTR